MGLVFRGVHRWGMASPRAESEQFHVPKFSFVPQVSPFSIFHIVVLCGVGLVFGDLLRFFQKMLAC